MLDRPLSLAALLLLFVCGCSSELPDSAVRVMVDPDGVLTSQGFTLKQADIPAFAKEVGAQPVAVIPITVSGRTPDFHKALDAMDQLRAAGLRNVHLGSASGS